MPERKPDESVRVFGIGEFHTYELTEPEQIELIAVIGKAAVDTETGEVLLHRPLTQLLVKELGTIEHLDDLQVIITIGRKYKR